MALKSLTPVLTPPATPPRCSLDPYKRRAPPPDITAPLPAFLRFSPRSCLTPTERRCLRFYTAIARPPRCRSSSGEARAELPVLPSLFCAPAGELLCTGAAGCRTPVSAPSYPRSAPPSVHGGPSAPWRLTTRGPGPHLYPLENNT
jgi:hypothetical protein